MEKFSVEELTLVQRILSSLIDDRMSFTGREVALRYAEICGSTDHVSTLVRELYNRNMHPFDKAKYGSTIVPHPRRPLLYFALPTWAIVEIDLITKFLEEQDATGE